eukprot:3822294-Lingulodinium_polyedra.AAC.1
MGFPWIAQQLRPSMISGTSPTVAGLQRRATVSQLPTRIVLGVGMNRAATRMKKSGTASSMCMNLQSYVL